jgi:hypothetical protein
MERCSVPSPSPDAHIPNAMCGAPVPETNVAQQIAVPALCQSRIRSHKGRAGPGRARDRVLYLDGTQSSPACGGN